MDILSNKFQLGSLDRVNALYSEQLKEYRADASADYDNEFLSSSFKDFYTKAIISNSLNSYNSLNWYWFKLIEKLVHLISIHNELIISEDMDITESEDELINFWSDSDYAKSFLEQLSETKDLVATSKNHQKLLEDQIKSFFVLHIDPTINIDESTYYNIPEIGESHQRIFLTPNSYLPLNDYKESDFIFTVSSKQGNVLINGQKFSSLNYPDIFKSFNVIYQTLDIQEHSSNLEKRISRALEIMRIVSPELYQTYNNFTDYLIPMNEKGIVSYSMQSLPGYSIINMFERDDVDLIDDLLHENGHHYMNCFLNVEELILEDDEKIYYSPWRKSLRPVRGVYHAYFTFYWAFELFHSLSTYHKLDSFFSNDQIDKIHFRVLEEHKMLMVCWNELLKANDDQKITETGFEIIKLINCRLESFNPNNSINYLKSNSEDLFRKYTEFACELDETIKHYS